MKQKTNPARKKNIGRILLTIIVLLTIQPTIFAQEQDFSVIGKWEKHIGGTIMTFMLDKDMNYTVDFESDGNVEVKGTYKIEGDQITFNDKPGGYASPDPGIYTYKMEKDKITFVIKNDPTTGRSSLLAGTWTKIKD